MRIVTRETVDSTNLDAKRVIKDGLAQQGLWIRAERQTAGRGRRGRSWTSEDGNLFASGLYSVSGNDGVSGRLSFIVALALYDYVCDFVAPEKVRIKWPNDVLIDGHKMAGILLETCQYANETWVIIGVGINLTSHPQDTPYPTSHIMAHIDPVALAGPEPRICTAEGAIVFVAHRFEHWLSVCAEEGFAPIRKAWLDRAYNFPGPVIVKLATETFTGYANDLGMDGELHVELEDGTTRRVYAGDVFFN